MHVKKHELMKNDFHMMTSIIKLLKGSKYVICRVVATSWFKIQLYKLNMKGFINSIGFICMSLITTHKYNKMWVAKPQFLLLINHHGCNFQIRVFFCIQSSVFLVLFSNFKFCVKCEHPERDLAFIGYKFLELVQKTKKLIKVSPL